MDLPIVKAFRFAVGTWEGLSSNSWKIWTNKDDVYIACRDNYGTVKWSLHAEGGWRVGFEKRAFAELLLKPKPETRWWDVWERPAQFAPGLTSAVVFSFFTSELPLGPEMRSTSLWDDVAMIEPAPDGFLVQVQIFLSDGRVPGRHPEYLPLLQLAHLRLANGENVIVLASQERLTDERRRSLGVAYRQISSNMADSPDLFGSAKRVLLQGRRDDGTSFASELSADRPHPDPLLVF